MARGPLEVIPEALAHAIEGLEGWFVIGGQAVRCLSAYRGSRDVDLGVRRAQDLETLVAELGRRGRVEVQERGKDTIHLRFEGIKVSIFVLEKLAGFVEHRRLNVTGILATKLHAVLDRGTRRDFFDLYVTLQVQRLGIAECLAAMREIYGAHVNEALLLRSLTYFDDAEREAPLAGEGPRDWDDVKEYLLTRVGQLLVPPARALEIQRREVDVRDPRPAA
ncbi:MAG: nucleotidyl transferase AbiEii/AbiGii toxin family protein [Deltaproteobacteria bacterium]|nr:nucleotidyl transferase AbiEii/AbiGii toxin family protein [Deltaproteobacteria bacterium]